MLEATLNSLERNGWDINKLFLKIKSSLSSKSPFTYSGVIIHYLLDEMPQHWIELKSPDIIMPNGITEKLAC